MWEILFFLCFISTWQCGLNSGMPTPDPHTGGMVDADPYTVDIYDYSPSTTPAPYDVADPDCEGDGLIDETVCMTTYCFGGRIVFGCKFCPPHPMCVDWIHKPEDCCESCPNGPNCAYTDGTIIPVGPSVNMTDGNECFCKFKKDIGQYDISCNPDLFLPQHHHHTNNTNTNSTEV